MTNTANTVSLHQLPSPTLRTLARYHKTQANEHAWGKGKPCPHTKQHESIMTILASRGTSSDLESNLAMPECWRQREHQIGHFNAAGEFQALQTFPSLSAARFAHSTMPKPNYTIIRAAQPRKG